MEQLSIRKEAAILALVTAFLGGYLIRPALPLPDDASTPAGTSSPRISEPAIRRYAEALAHIAREATFSPPVGSPQDIVTSSLKAYLGEKDPYSDFLTREEYAKFVEASRGEHAGIGLDIEKRRNGDIICYPLPNGPAAKAGIKPGEQLLSLDGVATRGKSLPAIIAMAAGREGIPIVAKLESSDGSRREVTITRAKFSAPAVSEYTINSRRIIRLASFTPSTRQELDYLVSKQRKRDYIILDLRGCGGGDFYAAVDSAMLFLEKGDEIVSVSGHSGSQAYSATVAHELPAQRVFLWQDEFTASAAEIFIAALAENDHGISVGMTTAGKGTRQDIIKLQDGAALILTTGYLSTPSGIRFDGLGLKPMHEVEGNGRDEDAFFSKTTRLAG
ncbi:MAG TPA: S41 family peptidase [Nitrosospira sp.]